MIGVRRGLARLMLRRGLTALLVFGAFGLTALARPTFNDRLAGVCLAFLCFAFSRNRTSQVIAILLFWVASMFRFDRGIAALLLIWAVRSAVGERARRRLVSAASAGDSEGASEVSPPTPLSVDDEVARLRQAFGARWMVEALYGPPEVQSRASAAMAQIPLDAIPETIERLANLGDSAAAHALIDHVNTLEKWDRESFLVSLAHGNHHVSIREAALAKLADSIDERSAPALISAMARTRSADPEFVGLLTGLGRSAVTALLDGLGHPHRHVRSGCLNALGVIKAEGARGAIAECLRAREPVVRVAAAMALAEIGSADSLPALLATAGDKSWEVREAVAKGLGQLGALAAASNLTRLIGDPHPEVATAAAAALAMMSARREPQEPTSLA
jgi:hypothetical protein